jgi:chorismate lyase/3-hydroxybenzoate synthase
VYVRDAGDVAAVQRVMNERCGAAPAVFLQADICRKELLVEIEAVAGPTL